MEKFLQLRREHPVFSYDGFDITDTSFTFHFSMGNICFNPMWHFELPINNVDHRLLEYAVFNLGLAELVSYWKCACSPMVEINCGALNNAQIRFWKKLWFNGLGEFFYKNNVETDVDTFMEVRARNNEPPVFDRCDSGFKGCLIPVGGGKDSVVTMELLRESMTDNLCYIINPRGATLGCAHTAGYGDSAIVGVRRSIDPELLRLNAEGYLNGHTPFSSVIAFSTWIFAYLTGKRYITLSNESSANEGNVSGTQINHQYSKSTEFEADFREYASKWLSPVPEYFSLLRPWSEWQIAREFCRYPRYFGVFQSCNVGSKTDTWCGKCAKCLYVYIMLSAFLDDDTLEKIFGANMLDNPAFTELFNGLVYEDENKPFECVGTRDEIHLALEGSIEKRSGQLPFLLAEYAKTPHEKAPRLNDFYDSNSFLPPEFAELLKGRNNA